MKRFPGQEKEKRLIWYSVEEPWSAAQSPVWGCPGLCFSHHLLLLMLLLWPTSRSPVCSYTALFLGCSNTLTPALHKVTERSHSLASRAESHFPAEPGVFSHKVGTEVGSSSKSSWVGSTTTLCWWQLPPSPSFWPGQGLGISSHALAEPDTTRDRGWIQDSHGPEQPMPVKGLFGAGGGLMLIWVPLCSQERTFTPGIMLKEFYLFLHTHFGRLRLFLAYIPYIFMKCFIPISLWYNWIFLSKQQNKKGI